MSVKWKLTVKSLEKKCEEALRDLESDLSNKEVAEKHGVPKNNILTWAKNKEKYFTALGKSPNKRKKLRESDNEKINNVVFIWFLSKRSQMFQ